MSSGALRMTYPSEVISSTPYFPYLFHSDPSVQPLSSFTKCTELGYHPCAVMVDGSSMYD